MLDFIIIILLLSLATDMLHIVTLYLSIYRMKYPKLSTWVFIIKVLLLWKLFVTIRYDRCFKSAALIYRYFKILYYWGFLQLTLIYRKSLLAVWVTIFFLLCSVTVLIKGKLHFHLPKNYPKIMSSKRQCLHQQ